MLAQKKVCIFTHEPKNKYLYMYLLYTYNHKAMGVRQQFKGKVYSHVHVYFKIRVSMYVACQITKKVMKQNNI